MASQPRLLDLVRREVRAQGLGDRTADSYVRWVRRYVLHHDKQHPSGLGEEEIRAFLQHLGTDEALAASTVNQAHAALCFLYRSVLRDAPDGLDDIPRAKGRKALPTVLSRSEVRAVLDAVPSRSRLPALLLYGAGLRLTEALTLRVRDLQLDRRTLHIHAGKGDRDRVLPLPVRVLPDLTAQIERVSVQHRADLHRGAGWVEVPPSIAHRSPEHARELAWQWVFPATRPYTHDATGQVRRHHLHPTVLQRDVKQAVARAGLAQRITCHTLRHCYATHLLEAGTNLRTVQKLLGHADVRTTMIYTHVLRDGFDGVVSPLDCLPEPP